MRRKPHERRLEKKKLRSCDRRKSIAGWREGFLRSLLRSFIADGGLVTCGWRHTLLSLRVAASQLLGGRLFIVEILWVVLDPVAIEHEGKLFDERTLSVVFFLILDVSTDDVHLRVAHGEHGIASLPGEAVEWSSLLVDPLGGS